MSDATPPGRIGAVIPMRLSSSRLPRKPLLDVAGKTSLGRVVEPEFRAAERPEVIVLATTADAVDDDLVGHAETLGLSVYRGSVHDVLRRLSEAATAHDLDVVVEVDGDDLLCSSEHMDRGVDALLEGGADYVAFDGLPLGATPNILRTSALTNAVAWKHYDDTETGIFRFLVESGRFRVERIPDADPAHHHDAVRMTLDYPEDLAFFRAVYEHLDRTPRWTLADLVALLRARPELAALNAGLDERYKAHFSAGLAEMEPDGDPA